MPLTVEEQMERDPVKTGLITSHTNEECSGCTTFRREFEKFCNGTPNYEDWADMSRTFFDKNAVDDYLVIRREAKGGVSYMHACAVFQHYLQCKRSGTFDHKILDVTTFMRDHFNNQELKAYFLTGVGGGQNTLDFLKRIVRISPDSMNSYTMMPKSQSETEFDLTTDKVLNHFSQFKEPALVSKFLIEKDFIEGENASFDYEVEERKFDEYATAKSSATRALHSMVLIGAHKEQDTGKVWFLLQNCWKGKYICLVSAEYMASCQATITFVVKNHDVALLEEFDSVVGMYVETEETPEECAEESF
eukprot:scaffold6461_cov48-Attheya_sp.AAC.7